MIQLERRRNANISRVMHGEADYFNNGREKTQTC